jgi:HEAT repeat protein
MTKLLLCALTLQCALTVAAIAQTDVSPGYDPDFCASGLTTVRQCLEDHSIPLTKDGLMSALNSKNPNLSSLAAGELANEGVKDAIPDLFKLFEAEPEPLGKIGLARDLAALGDQRGVQALRRYCDEPAMSMGDRLSAANNLVRYQPKSCPKTLIEGLQDDFYRGQALGMIPNFKELSPGESAQVRTLLLKSLWDQDSHIRLSAAQTMEGLGDESYIPSLEAAMAKEPTDFVRGAMENTVKTLSPRAKTRRILEESLFDQDVATRLDAAQRISEFGNANTVFALEGAIAKEANPVVKGAMEDALRDLQSKQQ